MALLSKYKVVTITHRNLNVNDIGHFFLRKNETGSSHKQQINLLKDTFQIQECLYLETCNRVTFLFYADVQLSQDFLSAFFKLVNPDLEILTLENINKFVTVYEGQDAVQHIFEMASSMDSLVVGEREIFRQLRKAYEKCRDEGLTADNLRLLDKATVTTAKEVYHNTKIGEKPLSVVSLAMNALLKSQVAVNSRVVLVGAGETNSLVAKFLTKYRFSNIKIYNRSLHNASELSAELGADSYHIQELGNIKGQFDIIFICTVPRNVCLSVVEENDVHHIDIDGLRLLSEENLEFRKTEVEKARPIIAKNIDAFNRLFQRRQIEKAMSDVPKEISTIKSKALNSVYKDRIAGMDETSKELLLEMMDYMEKKCISVPMKLAKQGLE